MYSSSVSRWLTGRCWKKKTIKRKLVFVFSFICFSLGKKKNRKKVKRKSIFILRLFALVKANNKWTITKRKLILVFSFICFSLGKKQKTIKQKLIFVFRLFVSFSLGKKKNRKKWNEIRFLFCVYLLSA